jgi:hypothetical protein
MKEGYKLEAGKSKKEKERKGHGRARKIRKARGC